MRLPFSAFCLMPFAALALVSCSSESEPPAPVVDEEPAALPPPDPAMPARVNDDLAPDVSPDERFSSRYFTFDLDSCIVLSRQTEGEGATFRCPENDIVPIFVQSGDGRFDMDAGVDDGSFQTIEAFNEIAPRVEVRMDNGRPFAVIFRYRDMSLQSNNRTVLAVEKIGTVGDPGCRIAQIGGGSAASNARARAIADRNAQDFDCSGSQEAQFFGDAQ